MIEDQQLKYKIIVASFDKCGKTTLIGKYLNLNEDHHSPTLYADYKDKNITLKNGQNAKIEIWDTTSDAKFKRVTKVIFKDTRAIIFLYDITDKKSFDNAKEYYNFMKDYITDNVIAAIVGNKLDLIDDKDDDKSDNKDDNNDDIKDDKSEDFLSHNDSFNFSQEIVKREVTKEEGRKYADENNLMFYEVSAINGTNVKIFFDTLIQYIYDNDNDTKSEKERKKSNKIKLRKERQGKKGCCK
jgi:small GTP-binding protein